MKPFPYQKVAINKAAKHQRFCLYDAPGLGKTIEAFLSIRARHGKVKIVWFTQGVILQHKTALEAEALGLKAHILTKPDKYDECADVVILNYEKSYSGKFSHILEALTKQNIVVVLDESHALKNNKAKRTVAVRSFIYIAKPKTILSLTATPIGKDERDIVSQWEVMGFPEAQALRRNLNFRPHPFIRGAWVCEGWKDEKYARDIISRYSICRTEDEVEGMPSLTTSTLPIPISPTQLRKRVAADVGKDDLKRHALIADYMCGEKLPSDPIIATIIQSVLRQASFLKARAVAEYVGSLVEEGESVVVFAQHLAPMKEFCEHFQGHVATITGETKEGERLRSARLFAEGQIKVLMCSYKVAGVGIDLIAARRVVLLEPHWEPAMVKQAIGRVRRVSQKASACFAEFAVGVGEGELLRIEGQVAQNHARKREAARSSGLGGSLG